LGLEGGTDFEIGKLAASDHEQTERNAIGRLRRRRHDAQPGKLADESVFQSSRTAIENTLKVSAVRAMAITKALP
jgi:hypothetical protein